LFDRLIKQKSFSEKDTILFMKQLLSAVAYCHSKNVAHRDLKPENLLLDSDGKDPTLKVIDFGTSQIFDSDHKIYGRIGTPLYVAPEVLSGSYTEKCDIWSCGVILYVLLSGSQPFHGSSKTEVFHKITHGAYKLTGGCWRSISREAKDLINNMLVVNPDKRYTAIKALNHPWLQNGREDTVSSEETKELLNNLSQYNAQYKLQQASLTYIVSQLVTNKEKEQLQKVFIALDKDKDGKVSKEDLIQGFNEYFGDDYPAKEQVEAIMDQIDIDGNGYIDLTEFVIATINKKNLLSEERLMAAFNVFDQDKNGSISVDEVKNVLSDGSDIPNGEWHKIISEVDQNGDGKISLAEFLFMMKKLIKD
jgi:calcium-dependent protein kinase